MLAKHIKITTPFVLIIFAAFLIGIFYSEYPERVPLYFNWTSKSSDGFGDKNLVWLSPVIHFLIAVLLLKMIQVDNQASLNSKHSSLTIRMLKKLNVLNGLICFLTSLILTMDLFLNFQEARLFFHPLMAALLFLTIGYYFILFLKAK
jgi:hypothetical protein